jgi:dTDP-4-amino-4,6-dideoxygalactose transaminase
MKVDVPFFRPDIGEAEIKEVVGALESGWITTGPRVKQFEEGFATAVGARHAVAMNSCTAALHLAVHALGLRAGEAVLVPTMTFAATAEVVLYHGGIPILVDCDPDTLNMDLLDAERKIQDVTSATALAGLPRELRVVGMIPVHVGGLMMNVEEINSFARRHALWVVEDAAHAFPAAWRRGVGDSWQYCGQQTADVSCFSFYANKTITTGEGGMAVTADPGLAAHLRTLSLHGLSNDAWDRYSSKGSWDYRILAPGYKYNMTDIAAAIGIHQLARAEDMRRKREAIANTYYERLADVEEIELPLRNEDRIHSWHLFPIRLRPGASGLDRDACMSELGQHGIKCSVHWRPLHLHPYYEATFGWRPEELPVASRVWQRLVSLPIFPGMTPEAVSSVIDAIRATCKLSARHGLVIAL